MLSSSLTWWDYVILVTLTLWTILSAFSQIRRPKINILSRIEPYGIIPQWRLFAPNPGTSDYYLLYRNLLPNGTVTKWQEVTVAEPRRILNFIWNPARRLRKARISAVLAMCYASPQSSSTTIPFSVPYTALVNYIKTLPQAPEAVAIQFLITEINWGKPQEQMQILFLSDLHNL